MIQVGKHTIPDTDLTWRFSRASGPGGQGVNTTDSRVQLTYDLATSDAFGETVKGRMMARLGGVVTVTASEHRAQLSNRRAAEERLIAILEQAMKPPPRKRVPTKPSKGSQQRRVDQKKARGETKRLRARPEA